jgi:hypothetical protein
MTRRLVKDPHKAAVVTLRRSDCDRSEALCYRDEHQYLLSSTAVRDRHWRLHPFSKMTGLTAADIP